MSQKSLILLILAVIFNLGSFGQLNLVQPNTITGTATLFTPSSVPTDIIVDPIVTPLTDPTSTTVSSYSDGSLFNNVYIWNLTANTITMNFAPAVGITGVAIWNAFASGAYLDPGFLEPDHSVNLANFEFFSGGVSLGSENINVLFPDDAFGELYPFAGTYSDVDQVVMTVISNHGGNETAMQEIAFNTITCDELTTVVSATDICLGEEFTLEGTSVNGGVITWDGGVDNGVPFTPVAAGTVTYNATSTSPDDCPFSVDITVHDLPTVIANVDDADICLDESVIFTGGGADSYSWDMGVVDGVAFTPAVAGLVTYTVTGTTLAAGCENTATVDVMVNDIPIVTASVDDDEICLGESIIFSGGGADTYVWDMGVVDGVAFTPMAVGVETYTVTGTDAVSGCENTASIDVEVLDEIPVVANVSDANICIGESVIFTGSGADTYIWDMGVVDGVSFTPVAAGTFTFNMLGTITGGCSGVDDVTITVHPLPIVNFIADETKGCAPFATSFSSSTPGATYMWSFGDGGTGSGASVNHNYPSAGEYDVTLTVITVNGCTATDTYVDYISVVETPIASFTYSPTSINITNTEVVFTNTSLYGNTFEWDFNDGSSISTDENPTHSFPVIGNRTYNVVLTVESDFGCQDVAEQLITVEDALFYYIPNAFTPDGDSFNEEFKPIFDLGLDVYDYHLIIFNRWGEIMFESYDAGYGWNGAYGSGEIAADGVYTWTIEFGETMSDKKHNISGHVILIR